MKHTLLFIFISLCFLNNLSSQVNLNNGLVAYYPFNGNANDASGNNNNGVLKNGINPGEDRFGNPANAFYFDGLDDYISISDDLGNFSTPNFSVVIWFKSESNALQNLIGKRDFGPTNGQQYQFFINYPPAPGIGSNIISNLNNCDIGITSSTSYINSGNPLCSKKWYCAVITFDGTLHKIYINGELKKSVPTGFTSMSQCNSELRFGNWWESDLIPFQGFMDDIRWYNRAINTDEVAVLSKDISESSNYDFTFEQQLCSPLTVMFSTKGSTADTYKWTFGDNTTAGSTIRNPVYTYQNKGVYEVQLVAGSGACTDTVKKTVAINFEQKKIIRQSDTSICSGTTLSIESDTSSAWCWGPANIPGSNVLSTITVTPSQTTTYSLHSYEQGSNLVQNGEFSAGNSGFTSEYTYSPTNAGSGEYFVGTTPNAWNNSFCAACGDHTSGNGNMLMVNGSNESGKKIWTQQMVVLPNTNYIFSFWTYTFSQANRPSLSFLVNNINTGNSTYDAAESGVWVKRQFTWYSGSATTAELTLMNINTSALSGNDFALDDIQFSTISIVTDSVTIRVLKQLGKLKAGSDTTVCNGGSVQLAGSGSSAISWSPATGLSDATSANPIATPSSTTTYIISSLEPDVCSVNDTVTVQVNPRPLLQHSGDTSICSGRNDGVQLSAEGGMTYNWSPAAGLNSPNIATPYANPATTTLYTVVTENEFGCADTGKVNIIVAPFVPVSASGDTSICSGNPLMLQASGASAYSWSPSAGLSDPSSANPVFTGNQTTTFIVSSPSAGSCSGRDTVTVTVNLSPQLQLSPREVLICNGADVRLTASGGNNYTWTPSAGLNNPDLADPIARPQFTTTYVVQTTDINGCTDTASVKVIVGPKGKLFVPNAFTPNGDGLNDCIGIKGADGSTSFEFAIYNRFGERVFFTTNPNTCWNGVFRGVSQPSGTFAWYLRVQSPCGPVTDKGLVSLIR